MKTPCAISKINPDHSISTIYCSESGYKSYTGELLFSNYSSEEQISELISLGHIQELKPTTKEIATYHKNFDEPLEIKRYKNMQEYLEIEGSKKENQFHYLWDRNQWHCLRSEHVETVKI